MRYITFSIFVVFIFGCEKKSKLMNARYLADDHLVVCFV
jgi:hypothetical protein